MNAGGIALSLFGVLMLCQVIGGHALERLGVLQDVAGIFDNSSTSSKPKGSK